MRKKTVILLVCLALVFTFTGCDSVPDSDSADTVIIGNIYTANCEEDTVSALAIKDGVYVYVGDEEGVQEYIGDETEVITLEEGMAMPSFTDGHVHGSMGGVSSLFEVNLYEATTVEEYIDMIGDFIKTHPDLTFIRGGGWYNGYFPNGLPTAEMLDVIDTDLPIALSPMDCHSYWVNSKAMELMGVDANTPDIQGGVIERDSKGNPVGCFRENAMELVSSIIPEYSVEEYKAGILAWQDEAMSYGITTYWDPSIDNSNVLQAYKELEEEGNLKIRVYGGYPINCGEDALDEVDKCKTLIEETAGGNFSINAIKIFNDGVVEGKTGYLLEDYADTPGFRSEPLWDQDSLNQLFVKADSLGITIHTHAIVDGANRMIVDACEYAYKQHGDKGNRHAITHLQLMHPQDIARMAQLNMIASVQPYWQYKEEGLFYEIEIPYLGEERANSTYPMKSFFDSGVVVSSSSDYPVSQPPKPLKAIQIGTTRCSVSGDPDTIKNPDERVTVKQMISSFTINGAYQLFSEDIFGSVEVGKSADLIILDKNILEIDPVKIGSVDVVRTLLEGETIYKAD
ncbi:MAG: amidohydrolase [Eubacteriales bacterium]|nr:amidohydrolase [Eubacteriales bacterium]